MISPDLSESLSRIFIWEGGFAIRDTEPGGAVNMGVSMQTFKAWRSEQGRPEPTVDDLRDLTQDEAVLIYQKLYADEVRFDALSTGVNYCVLDSAVNEGVGGTLKFLAEAVNFSYIGKLPVDALIAWKKSQTAVSIIDIINFICDARLDGKRKRVEWAKFGPGWTNRIQSVRSYSILMATPSHVNKGAVAP